MSFSGCNFMLSYIIILHCLKDGSSQTIGCGLVAFSSQDE